MKRILSFVGGFMLLLIIGNQFTLQADSGTVYDVGVDQLVVRANPDLNAQAVGTLTRGDKVTIFKEKYGWGQTYYNGKEAWVATYLLVNPSKTSSKKTVKKSTNKATASVIANGVRLRSGPSTNDAIIGSKNKGDAINIIRTQGDWHEVKLSSGKTAWIAAWLTSDATTSTKSTKKTKATPVSNQSLKGKNIVLDPGHGGYDPGSTALNGVFEKQLTMDMAKAIGNALEAKGATVLYTRSNDRYVSLYDRVRISNAYWTDAFISIHFNAFTNNQINGISTHYYGGNNNYQLATAIQNELIGQTGLHNRGVQLDNYYVLRENNDTSVLLELGFLTNQSDLNEIMSGNYRARVAESVANGLANYFQ